MKNIEKVSQNMTALANEQYAKTKVYQNFINVLSQIIEKHGTEVLSEINHVK